VADPTLDAFVQGYLSEGADVNMLMGSRSGVVVAAAEAVAECFSRGGKVLLAGNGGSAADCQHFAAEFVSRLTADFDRPGLPAIALTTDTSFVTAFANDVGFDGVFERQVQTLGRAGDILIAISTSGNSPNVLRAVEAARRLEITTIGLMGEGGRLEALVDCAVVIPSRQSQHIQETLLAVEHMICHMVERSVFPGGS
jgi:D-sedoheptulose 7-phosphate isomerase